MSKSDKRIRQALNRNICKLAQALYDKDIVCGQACPLIDHDCPLILLQDAGDIASELMEKLIIEIRKR